MGSVTAMPNRHRSAMSYVRQAEACLQRRHFCSIDTRLLACTIEFKAVKTAGLVPAHDRACILVKWYRSLIIAKRPFMPWIVVKLGRNKSGGL